jgi:hypothetical protein
MIEAWWRSLRYQRLFLHSLDTLTTVRRLVPFYVDGHPVSVPYQDSYRCHCQAFLA